MIASYEEKMKIYVIIHWISSPALEYILIQHVKNLSTPTFMPNVADSCVSHNQS